MLSTRFRALIIAIWALLILAAVYVTLVRPDFARDRMANLTAGPVAVAAVAYLMMGCIRGFTLIPVTYLLPFGLLVFDPPLMFVLTMVGIAVSSASVYYFSEQLRLAEYFETRHPAHVSRIRDLLRRNELPIVVGWSFFPLVPTDLICYVCGSLGVDIRKLLLGVLVGEGAICAIYIGLGRQVLALLRT